MDEITITDDTVEETYRLALESIYRWSWRTDELEPMDIIRAIKRVAETVLKDNG